MTTAPDPTTTGTSTGRTPAEGALRDRAERFQLALSAARMGTWDWDLTTDAMTWDAQQHVLFDIRPEDFTHTGRQALEIIFPDDRPHVDEVLARARETHAPFRVEFRIRYSNGSLRWLVGYGQPITDTSGAVTRMIGSTSTRPRRRRRRSRYGISTSRWSNRSPTGQPR